MTIVLSDELPTHFLLTQRSKIYTLIDMGTLIFGEDEYFAEASSDPQQGYAEHIALAILLPGMKDGNAANHKT